MIQAVKNQYLRKAVSLVSLHRWTLSCWHLFCTDWRRREYFRSRAIGKKYGLYKRSLSLSRQITQSGLKFQLEMLHRRNGIRNRPRLEDELLISFVICPTNMPQYSKKRPRWWEPERNVIMLHLVYLTGGRSLIWYCILSSMTISHLLLNWACIVATNMPCQSLQL